MRIFIRIAVNMNIYGTKKVVDLCKQLKNFQVK